MIRRGRRQESGATFPFIGWVGLFLLLPASMACSSHRSSRVASPGPSVAVQAGTRTAEAGRPSTPASNAPGSPPATQQGDPATYTEAVTELQAFLDAWRQEGWNAAAGQFLDANVGVGSPDKLLDGSVVSYQPYQWVSHEQFTLLVVMDLHFPGQDGITWGEGQNTRFVTFSRPIIQEHFVIHLASGPAGPANTH